MKRYLDAVKMEIDLLLKKTRLEDANIEQLYLGGGTPTCLTSEQLTDIISYLKEKLNIDTKATFTCEAIPSTIISDNGRKKLEVLLENGVNRLSIGIESFNDAILRTIERGYDAKMAISAINNAREVGFKDIDIELIFGLPDQTPEKWEHDLNMIADLRPESLDLYHLSLKHFLRGSLPMYKMFAKEPNRFPNEDMNILMKIMAFERLKEIGYKIIDTAQFTLASLSTASARLYRKSFISMAGVGATTRTELSVARYKNWSDFKKYINLIEKGKLPFAFGIKLTKRQLMERELIFKLRQQGLNKNEFETRFGIKVEKVFGIPLRKLEKIGLIVNNEESISFSYKGRLLGDYVLEQFIQQLKT